VLRTKQQLGYIVWRGLEISCGVVGYYVQVVSGNYSAGHLHARINAFLHAHLAALEAMPPGAFRQQRAALVGKMRQKDTCLREETGRHWTEITLRRYQFGRKAELVKEVEKVTQAQVVALYKAFLLPGAAQRAVLAVHVHRGAKAASTEGDGVHAKKGSEDEAAPTAEKKASSASAGKVDPSSVPSADDAKKPAIATAESKEAVPPPAREERFVHGDDEEALMSFRSTLSYYPDASRLYAGDESRLKASL